MVTHSGSCPAGSPAAAALGPSALVCVVSDAATGRDPELAIHLRMARRQGWTEEEVGVPIIRESLLTASRVEGYFKEMNNWGRSAACSAPSTARWRQSVLGNPSGS